jgi:hypothetical protein
VEFTVEPFIEGKPGPHVTRAVAAVEARGLTVDFSLFGSSFEVEVASMPEVVADAMGVSHITVYNHLNSLHH